MAVHRSQILCLVLDENNYITNDGGASNSVLRGGKFRGKGTRVWSGLRAVDVREGGEGNEGGGEVAGHHQVIR